ncbi:ankyrin repeat and SOCS box protein 12 [Geospiza fortis]|uniref:Ankyrin repeat and SOCS box protein 12 n=1 Tax=Geospiza fortis TaxID=48883 RepID=A0A6I9HT82_GEOFO|nr:ankyrin repeat and SOCS box protein 12 [Geospiza fortis]
MEPRPDKMTLMDINKMFSLLQPGDAEEDSGESEELSRAVCQDDHEALAGLLSQDSYRRLINRRSGWGVPCSPLRLAAARGSVRSLRLLLEHGAEPNARARLPEWAANTAACSGPLYLAAAYGHLECFRLLLLHGADPDYNCTEPAVLAQIREPKTLLETCLRHGCRADFIRLLIDFGANVSLPAVPHSDGPGPRSEGLQLLLHARAHPKSLLSQSRLAMRRLLKQPGCLATLGELEIPTALAKYLQHQP